MVKRTELESQGLATNIASLNKTIAEQNGRFEASSQLSHPELHQLAQIGIADEQIDTFQELLETARPINYEGLAADALKLAAQIKEIDDELQVQPDVTPDEDLKREVELAASLAPRKAVEIYQFGEDEKERGQQVRLGELLGQRAMYAQAQTNILDFLSVHSEPWNIPQAIAPEDRRALHELVNGFQPTESETEFDFVDIIPLTPEERSSQASVAERAKTGIVTQNASNYISFYLAEYKGKTITVEELIRFLYVADVDPENGRDYRSNITTLLGPKVNGRVIDQKLHDEYGLELQYGMRILREHQGGRLIERRRTRIYRTIPVEEVVVVEDVEVETDLQQARVTDRWEPPKQIIVPEPAINDQESPLTIEASEGPVGVTAEDDHDDKETWQKTFREEVVKAVEILKQSYLFEEDVMEGSRIRAMSLSKSMGTKTMRERMGASNLIPRGAISHDVMSREQRLVGVLYNTHQELTGSRGKSKQREAMAIIREVLAESLKTDQ